jgi:hypothetical protein
LIEDRKETSVKSLDVNNIDKVAEYFLHLANPCLSQLGYGYRFRQDLHTGKRDLVVE